MEKKTHIIVYCHGFMSNRYFYEQVLKDVTYEQAFLHASSYCHQKTRTFDEWEFHIVKSRDQMEPEPRKLTWMERLTGRVVTEEKG